MKSNTKRVDEGRIRFRRYIRVRGTNKVLDAHAYGYAAFPIKIRKHRR